MRKRVDLGDFVEVGVNPPGTSQSVASVDVHCTRATNTWEKAHCTPPYPGPAPAQLPGLSPALLALSHVEEQHWLDPTCERSALLPVFLVLLLPA